MSAVPPESPRASATPTRASQRPCRREGATGASRHRFRSQRMARRRAVPALPGRSLVGGHGVVELLRRLLRRPRGRPHRPADAAPAAPASHPGQPQAGDATRAPTAPGRPAASPPAAAPDNAGRPGLLSQPSFCGSPAPAPGPASPASAAAPAGPAPAAAAVPAWHRPMPLARRRTGRRRTIRPPHRRRRAIRPAGTGGGRTPAAGRIRPDGGEHGGQPHRADRDQRPRHSRQAAGRQPHRDQQPPGPRPGRQGLVHPPHRVRGGPGRWPMPRR